MPNFLEKIKSICEWVSTGLIWAVIGSFNAGVFSMMWNWFVAPAIETRPISVGTGFGMLMIFFLWRIWLMATTRDGSLPLSLAKDSHWFANWFIAPMFVLIIGGAVHFLSIEMILQ